MEVANADTNMDDIMDVGTEHHDIEEIVENNGRSTTGLENGVGILEVGENYVNCFTIGQDLRMFIAPVCGLGSSVPVTFDESLPHCSTNLKRKSMNDKEGDQNICAGAILPHLPIPTRRATKKVVPAKLKDEAYRTKRATKKINIQQYLKKRKADMEEMAKLNKSIAKIEKKIRKEEHIQKRLLSTLKDFVALWDSESSGSEDSSTTSSNDESDSED